VREHLSHLEGEGRKTAKSIAGAVVAVNAESGHCPACHGVMHVQKTVRRNIVTLHLGAFTVVEKVLICAAGCRRSSGEYVTLRSSELSHMVAPGANYSYDMEVHIGMERYIHHRQRTEICRDLEARGISLSTGEVSILANRFLQHLKALHYRRAQVFQDALLQDGGYPLHVDATGEDGRGTLFVAYAGWRGWVLGSWKLSTERADQILPCLQEVVSLFGQPVALMRDLGRAVSLAAHELVAGFEKAIPVLSCHLHFLRDIGKDLLEASYDQLRCLTRRFKVLPNLRKLIRDLGRRLGGEMPVMHKSVIEWTESEVTGHELPSGFSGLAVIRALAQWVLDFSADSRHLGFPFDRAYLDLFNRCHKVRRALDAYFRTPPHDKKVYRALHRLVSILDPVVSEGLFASTARTLAERASLFDELRNAMRLNPKGSTNTMPVHLPDDSVEKTAVHLQNVREALEKLTDSLHQRRPERGPAQDIRKAIDLILEHMRVHGDSLWGHVIQLPKESGGLTRIVERTNNLMENFFHRMKHGERRRSGRKVLTQDFESMPAEAALVYNLNQPDYVELLCGSLDSLPDAFAQMDAAQRAGSIDKPQSTLQRENSRMASASLSHAERIFIRRSPLQKRIERDARSRAPRLILAGK